MDLYAKGIAGLCQGRHGLSKKIINNSLILILGTLLVGCSQVLTAPNFNESKELPVPVGTILSGQVQQTALTGGGFNQIIISNIKIIGTPNGTANNPTASDEFSSCIIPTYSMFVRQATQRLNGTARVSMLCPSNSTIPVIYPFVEIIFSLDGIEGIPVISKGLFYVIQPQEVNIVVQQNGASS